MVSPAPVKPHVEHPKDRQRFYSSARKPPAVSCAPSVFTCLSCSWVSRWPLCRKLGFTVQRVWEGVQYLATADRNPPGLLSSTW